MDKYLISYDIGTSATKAVLFSEKGVIKGIASSSYPVYYASGGKAEQDADSWWNAVIKCTRELISGILSSDIIAVSLCGHMGGATFLDSAGNLLRPSIIWLDKRAVEQTSDITSKIDTPRHFSITGRAPTPVSTAAKVMWIKKHQPDIYENTAMILQSKDYIAFKLTKCFITDYSDASVTNLFDITKKEWSNEIFGITGLDKSKFPKAVPSTQIIGTVSQAAALQTGLTVGTPVIIGGGDSVSSAVGTRCVAHGQAYMSIGSSAWVGAVLDHQFPDAYRTYTSLHAIPGLYINHCNISSAGLSYKWISEVIYRHENDKYNVINEQILSAPPGSGGVVFLPYLMGDMCLHNNPLASASFTGITARTSYSDMLRSVIEGVCFYLDLALQLFFSKNGMPPSIMLTGGAIKGEPWKKILCDITGIPCLIPSYCEETASIGAGIIGGIGIGLFNDFSISDNFIGSYETLKPDKKNHDFYRRYESLFMRLYEALFPLYPDMNIAYQSK